MKLRAWLILGLTLAFAASSLLSDFGGYDAGQLPVPLADPPMQPAGWAFAIWGPIYLWLAASAAYGLLRRAEDPWWDATRLPLGVSLLVGVPWLSVAEGPSAAAPLWATVMIVAMWAGAVSALLRAPERDAADVWLLRAPVGLYAGWLTAATAVSFGLVGAGWGVWMGPFGWTAATLLLALAVALSVMRARPLPAYGAAVAWAFAGLAARNGWTTALGLAALAAALLTGLLAIRATAGRARPPRGA